MHTRVVLLFIFCTIVCASAVSTYRTYVSAAGNLIGYWKYDEASIGSTVIDSSGNGNHGTPFHDPVPTPDIPDVSFSNPGSLSFNGSNQHIRIPDNDSLTLVDGTFSTWIKFAVLPGSHVSWIAKRGADATVEYQWGWTGSALKVTLANGGSSCCTDYTYNPSPALTTGTWYHLAVVVDSTAGTIRWYQNGVFKHESDSSGHAFGTNTSANLTIGSSFNGSGEFLNGKLDETRIYNRVLTDEEIADLADGESGVDVPTETPTPSPTPTEAPTPTPASAPESMSHTASSGSRSHTSHCADERPSSAPDLFQISTTRDAATLYFAPVTPVSGYVVQYGTTDAADEHSVSFDHSESSGAVSYTVQALAPDTRYYFTVQGKHGCETGEWSQIMSQTTTGDAKPSVSSPIAQKETLEITQLQEPSSQEDPVSEKESESTPDVLPDGYDLTIRVMDSGKPVSGAVVEVHSAPRRTTTDADGIARFSGVEGGAHTVYLSYNGYEGSEKIELSGDEKDVDINLSITVSKKSALSGMYGFVLGAVVSTFILFLWWRRKRATT